MRRPRVRASAIWLAAAAVLAGAAALVGRGEPGIERRPLVVAAADLPAGTRFVPADLTALLEVRPDAVTAGIGGLFLDPLELAGRTTTAAIAAGEPVTEAALAGPLGSGPLRPGERAVPVPGSALGAAAAAIAPGVRVDVAVSGDRPGDRGAIVASDAEVLAVAGDEGFEIDAGGALLRVSAADALDVVAALDAGRAVRLLVRPAAGDAP